MHTLLKSLLNRAAIATPVMDATLYCTVTRAQDNASLGDITKLEYLTCAPTNGKWSVTGKSDESTPRIFRTEIEARADILRRYW